jgi:hypothetical protein
MTAKRLVSEVDVMPVFCQKSRNLRMGEQAVEDGLAIPLRSFSNHLTGLGEKTS